MNIFGVGPKILITSILALGITYFLFQLFLPSILIFETLTILKIFGAIMILDGIIIYFVSIIEIINAKKNQLLCTTGVFRYVRNPVYSAWIFLITPGIALITGILPILISVIWAILIFNLFIGEEEKELEQMFGEKYLKYKNKTSALIPKII